MTRAYTATIIAIVAALFGMLATPTARADTETGCQRDRGIWLFHGTVRDLCDGDIHPDGSWVRVREFWTPTYWVPMTCSGSYFVTCSGGYQQPQQSNGAEKYVVFPDNVLPDEPPHLVNGLSL